MSAVRPSTVVFFFSTAFLTDSFASAIVFLLPRHRPVDPDAGAHGAREGDALDVYALRRRGLGLDHGVDDDLGVLDQRVLREGNLADGSVDVAALVHAEGDLAALQLLDDLGH